jgi:hypothetical protein
MFGDKSLRTDLESLQQKYDTDRKAWETRQAEITTRLDKCVNYLNGLAKGKMDEKFGLMKKSMQTFIIAEVATVVEEKMIGIMGMLIGVKDGEPKVQAKAVSPQPTQQADVLNALQKEILSLNKTVKDLMDNKQKEVNALTVRLNKLETQFNKSNDLLERFADFFQKLDNTTPLEEIKID